MTRSERLGLGYLVTALAVALTFSACGAVKVDSVAAPEELAAQNPVRGTALPYLTAGNPDGPLVVVLGLGAQQTLESVYAWDGVPYLISAGYRALSVDLPCHGADQTDPQGNNLRCWAERIAAGDIDIFLRFCAGLSDVLDELHVKEAAIVGVSRGGYAAITCAAYDARFEDVALIAPVTDLNYLREFKALPVDESLFNTTQYVEYLQTRHNLLRIGAHDTRVGTSIAEIFGHKIGALEEILPTVGHYAPEDGSTVKFLQQYPYGGG